jgi:hypothetical protein
MLKELNYPTRKRFLKSIGSIPKEVKFQEKIMSYVIQVDGYGTAWTL